LVPLNLLNILTGATFLKAEPKLGHLNSVTFIVVATLDQSGIYFSMTKGNFHVTFIVKFQA